MGDTEYIVSTKHLSKYFKENAAVSDVSINIKPGEIYGLIGRNGAGKTTLMKMISGLTNPTEGEIILFGKTGNAAGPYRKEISNLLEAPGIYPNLTGEQNLHCKAIAMGIHKPGYEQELLQMVGLENAGKRKAGKYSLGMKQRLGIALAMVGDPKLLILDEPINGLDPQGIKEMREIFVKLKEEKQITILISSHILDELYKVADTFCFVNAGQVISVCTKEELEENNKSYLSIRTSDCDRAMELLGAAGAVNMEKAKSDEIHIFDHLEEAGNWNTMLVNNGLTVSSLTTVSKSIENIYLDMVGEGGTKS